MTIDTRQLIPAPPMPVTSRPTTTTGRFHPNPLSYVLASYDQPIRHTFWRETSSPMTNSVMPHHTI